MPPAVRTWRSAAALVRLVSDTGAIGACPGRTPRNGPRPCTAAVLRCTNRSTPARRASSTRASVPKSLTRRSSRALPPILAAQWTTASTPSQTPRSEAGSVRSPRTYATGAPAGSGGPLDGGRVADGSARTSSRSRTSPATPAAATTCPPTKPPEPVTRMCRLTCSSVRRRPASR